MSDIEPPMDDPTQFGTLLAYENSGEGEIQWATDLVAFAKRGEGNAIFALDIILDWWRELDALRSEVDAILYPNRKKHTPRKKGIVSRHGVEL